MKNIIIFLLPLLMLSCIGDDIIEDRVDPEVRILNTPTSIAEGETFQLDVLFLNNVGTAQEIQLTYISSNEDVATVSNSGLVTTLAKGSTTISIEASFEDQIVSNEFELEVSESTVIEEPLSAFGTIATTTFYTLEGDFTIERDDDGITILIEDNWKASSSLPGLYVYLTNNPQSTASALEIGAVEVFDGAHEYRIEGVDIGDHSHLLYFCKPFNVKVGDGQIKQ